MYSTLDTELRASGVFVVRFSRPEKRNSMNLAFFREIDAVFREIASMAAVRAVVLYGEGKAFSAGLDVLEVASALGGGDDDSDAGVDAARRGMRTRSRIIVPWQEAFDRVANCAVPVIAAVSGACIGGGVDLVLACDVRLASADAFFSVAEVGLGIVADLGTLARFSKVVGNDSTVRELAFTGRRFDATEAQRLGLVSFVAEGKEALLAHAFELAETIAALSPVAVAGTKEVLNFCRDHSVADGLRYVAAWNMSAVQTEDIAKAVRAQRSRAPVLFSNL
eukprot:Amastigsp_a3434_25.p1 type:complete len:279 gc:universal Amastigsp_a3434_25:70-906(+)